MRDYIFCPQSIVLHMIPFIDLKFDATHYPTENTEAESS